MSHAIVAVQRVGLRESAHHLLDSRWPKDAQRVGTALRPRLQVNLTKVADMIRVVMRQHHRRQLGRRDMPQRKVLRCARAGVHQIHVAAGENRRARIGAIGMGKRISGPAQDHAQRVVGEEIVARCTNVALDYQPEQRILDRRHVRHPPHESGEHHQYCGASGETFG